MNPLERLMPQGGAVQGSPLGNMQMPEEPQIEQTQGMSEEEIKMIEEIISILQQMSPEELEQAIAENPELAEFIKALEEAQGMTQGQPTEQPIPQQPIPQGGM